MKTNLLILVIFMAVIAFVAISCNKDENPDNQADPWTLMLEETIGPQGGTLGDTTFSLEIPAGVFSNLTTLSLYSSPYKLFNKGQISLIYEIRGFPEEFEGTLPVSIQRTGEIENEFYIAIGTRKFARSYGDTVYALNYLPSTDSAGYVHSEIRVQKPGNGSRDGGDFPVFDRISDGSASVGVVTLRKTIESSKKNFKVIYEVTTIPEAKAVMLGEALETALAKYQSMYFPKMEFLQDKYPIQVTYRPYWTSPLGSYYGDNQDDYGSYSTPRTGQSVNPSFDFNYNLLQEARDISIATGHECFHMVQSCYNVGGELKNWLTEATATYVEEFFVQGGIPPGTPYIPHVFSSHYVRSFLGMEAGASWIDPMSQTQKPSSSHGYGMALVIKYFCSLPGHESALPMMIMAIDEDEHPVDAVLSSLGAGSDPISAWENCMNDFVMRRVYPIMQDNFVQGEMYSNTLHAGTLTMDAISKPYQALTYSLPDLSVSLIRINLSGNFTSDQKLGAFYTTTGDMANIKSYTYYFKVKAGNGQRLEEIPDFGTSLKALKDNGYSILIMTLNERHVNPYTEKTDITIHVGLKGPTAVTNTASSVTATTATLNGKINPNEELTTGVFEYGLTTSYGNTLQLAQNQLNGHEMIPVSAELSDLQPEKMYYFRLVASNQSGTATGEVSSFKTLKENTGPPSATTKAATNVTAYTATLNGSVNPNGTQSFAEFEYGLTTAYGNYSTISTNPLNGDQPIEVSSDLSGLISGETYHFRITGYRQGFTDVTYGADMTFTTVAGGLLIGQEYQGGMIFYV
jgi:hypothetical protein